MIFDYDDRGVRMSGPASVGRGRRRPTRLSSESDAARGGLVRFGTASLDEARRGDVAQLRASFPGSPQVCSSNETLLKRPTAARASHMLLLRACEGR